MMAEQTIAPINTAASRPRRRRVGVVFAGMIACVFAVVFLVGSGWALWKDRVDRDASGFVSIGAASLRTETYAIVGDLHGDGPDWLWESDVLGDSRVRATSDLEQPLFIGIAPTDEVFRYLAGVGYATIENFEVTADTTQPGGAPSGVPSTELNWATSTQGVGEQTLEWDSRAGDWSLVLMNADAGQGVAVQGEASAELPILPWVAIGLLVIGGALGSVGGWLLMRTRGERRPGAPAEEPSQATSPPVPLEAHVRDEVSA